MSEKGRDPKAKPVHRGEGELSSWPRGLLAYTPARPEAERSLAEEEDRTAQRLELAGRLIAVLRSRGTDPDEFVRRLSAIRSKFRSGDRAAADRAIDALLADLGEGGTVGHTPAAPSRQT